MKSRRNHKLSFLTVISHSSRVLSFLFATLQQQRCLEVYETVGALGANMDAKMSDPAANAEFTQSSLEFWLMIE